MRCLQGSDTLLSIACCDLLKGSSKEAGHDRLTNMVRKFEITFCVIVPNPNLRIQIRAESAPTQVFHLIGI